LSAPARRTLEHIRIAEYDARVPKALAPAPDELFAALSDRTRLRLAALLRDGERCVCHLVAALEIPQPTASRHLAILRHAGLVTCRRDGIWAHYALARSSDPMRASLLAALGRAIERLPEVEDDRRRMKQVLDACC
jgi:ArsR family transcriptional regulator